MNFGGLGAWGLGVWGSGGGGSGRGSAVKKGLLWLVFKISLKPETRTRRLKSQA